MVSGLLCLLVLSQHSIQVVGLGSKTTHGMSTVAAHLLADLGDLLEEAVGQLLHAAGSLGLVLSHETTKLLVFLKVLLVTSITDLHHPLKLSRNLTVNLSLLELVVLNNTRELENGHLKVATEFGHTVVSLLFRGSNVGNGLGKTAVLERLVGVQGSIHTSRGMLERHISMGTIAGHSGTDLAELSRSLGTDLLDLVVGILAETLVLCDSLGRQLGTTLLSLLGHIGHFLVETVHGFLEVLASLLGVFLDLRSIGCNVLVGLLDLRIGSRSKSSESTLLGRDGELELLSSMSLVLTHDFAGLGRASNGGPVALVLALRKPSELSLDDTHVAIEVILGLLGVDSHLGQELLFHLGTSSLVVCEVLSHLGANSGDIGLAPSNFLGNLPLDLVEEGKQALAAIGGVRHNQTRLLDVHRLDGPGVVVVKATADISV